MIEQILTEKVTQAVKTLYQLDATPAQIQLQNTRKEFEGDITLVVFPFTKVSRKSPEATANEIGEFIQAHMSEIESFNVIKGFLNLSIKKEYWLDFLSVNYLSGQFGFSENTGEKPVVVEYSSPNTNKPLHLGHIRNNLLGFSLSRILQAAGKNVVKVNLVNDRGIHICKSMLAWQRWGNGETPESSGIKGDHLVGKYYVFFDKHFKEEIAVLVSQGLNAEEASKKAPLILEAQQILQKWEAGDEEVINLWKKMNGWVYDGFAITYKTLGIEFDKTYYESQTYLLGKELVEKGVEQGVYIRRNDGSVWVDLGAEGLDEKLLLRSDGTSVYMTQDLGTAQQRYDEYNPEQLIYVVGNEQEYHFNVLKVVLKHLGCDWADSIYHLSYGMVELPAGKMKSREGTVVDADDLMDEMFKTAEETTRELGKANELSDAEAERLFNTIGLGALKYYILKVDPKKQILFNPEESVDFAGNTGPFIQYTYARIQSILRKSDFSLEQDVTNIVLHEKEKELLKQLELFPEVIQNAAHNHSPALIANYTYDLVKEYNSFYQSVSILGETDLLTKVFRGQLSQKVGQTIKSAFKLLGIEVPERM